MQFLINALLAAFGHYLGYRGTIKMKQDSPPVGSRPSADSTGEESAPDAQREHSTQKPGTSVGGRNVEQIKRSWAFWK